MKLNKCRQRIEQNEIAVGHMLLEFGTRGIAQMVDRAGADFVIIDTEHSAFTSADLADLMAWFKATPVAPFVRIPQIQYHFIARTLDMGALGIMVPNVKTGEQAQAIVNAAKYAPLGDRGVILGQAHTDYRSVDPQEFMDFANQNTTVICQIESEEGLENIEAIARTPGVDILWVGHFDLTQSMGIPGQFHDERFLNALNLVVETTTKYGLRAGIQPGSLTQAQEWMTAGFNVISYSADVALYMDALSRGVADVRAIKA